MNVLERITVDPEVCGGRPCIRGLRIRVKDILEMLAAGAAIAIALGSPLTSVLTAKEKTRHERY